VAAGTLNRTMGLLATLVRIVFLVIVAFLVIHILLSVFGANPTNSFAMFIRTGADMLSLGLTNLFTPGDPKAAVAINYGIAAVIWLVIMSIVLGLIRRVG